MTEYVSTRWFVERFTPDGEYVDGAPFEVEVEGVFSWSPAYFDDPGECRLELDRVTCNGELFALTPNEERQLIDQWTEELQCGIDE